MTEDSLRSMVCSSGKTVLELSQNKTVLLVFLRHFGCTFCREALHELSELEDSIKEMNATLVLVYLSTEEIAMPYLERYELTHCETISDPYCKFYAEFGLMKGSFNQLFGFRSWVRGIESVVVKGHGVGAVLGDGFQMPGVFTIRRGNVVREFRHKAVSDRPDYLEMLKGFSKMKEV